MKGYLIWAAKNRCGSVVGKFMGSNSISFNTWKEWKNCLPFSDINAAFLAISKGQGGTHIKTPDCGCRFIVVEVKNNEPPYTHYLGE